MKTIILSEGKNDRKFIKCFFERHGINGDKIQFFDQEEKSILKELDRAESNYLRNFFEDSSPFEVLVKSEGGKTKVIRIFSDFMHHLFDYSKGLKIIMLVDLDGTELSSVTKLNQFITELRNKIQNKGKGNKLSISHEILKEDKHLKTSEVSVIIKENNDILGSFCLIAFNSSLERAAGIIKESDSQDEKDNKIFELLENEDVFNHLSYALM